MSPGTSVPVSHIRLDERGVAWVGDTNVKVIEVALDKRAHGSSPEEIYFQHYGHLSLGQIHAALAYYYDHQQQFEAEIEQQLAFVNEQRAKAGESIVQRKLRESGQRP